MIFMMFCLQQTCWMQGLWAVNTHGVIIRKERLVSGRGSIDVSFTLNGRLSSEVRHFSRTLSDHAPLLISFRNSASSEPRLFRFQQMWISHGDFDSVVKRSWEEPIYASPMYRFMGKLKRLKQVLKEFSQSTFGNVFKNVASAEDGVLEAQQAYDEDPNLHNWNQLNLMSAKKSFYRKLEECFWRQKAHMKWLREGDRNTGFFHHMAFLKKEKSSIRSLKDAEMVI